MKKYVLVDDIDGTEAVETVPFGFDGDLYEIDLSRENAKELRTLLARYAKVARPTRLRSGRSKNVEPTSSPKASRKASAKKANGKGVPSASVVRGWAREKGIEVTPTGRVPKALVEQYMAETH